MLGNGLLVVLDMALEARPMAGDRYLSLMLGMFREDVLLLPGGLGGYANPNPGHLWPFAPRALERFFSRAMAAKREGKELRAYYLLGRATHILIDMACPAHARHVWHHMRDPFERCVEGRAGRLAEAPVPGLPREVREGGPVAWAESLAQAARRERTDGTQTWWGRALKGLGLRRPLDGREAVAQADRLVPLAAAHVRVLLDRFETAG
jgi:hypothetical protein